MYVLEFRDEHELDTVMEKMAKAKKALMEACEALEEADNKPGEMNERGNYRDGMSYRRGRYRNGEYRDSRYDY